MSSSQGGDGAASSSNQNLEGVASSEAAGGQVDSSKQQSHVGPDGVQYANRADGSRGDVGPQPSSDAKLLARSPASRRRPGRQHAPRSPENQSSTSDEEGMIREEPEYKDDIDEGEIVEEGEAHPRPYGKALSSRPPPLSERFGSDAPPPPPRRWGLPDARPPLPSPPFSARRDPVRGDSYHPPRYGSPDWDIRDRDRERDRSASGGLPRFPISRAFEDPGPARVPRGGDSYRPGAGAQRPLPVYRTASSSSSSTDERSPLRHRDHRDSGSLSPVADRDREQRDRWLPDRRDDPTSPTTPLSGANSITPRPPPGHSPLYRDREDFDRRSAGPVAARAWGSASSSQPRRSRWGGLWDRAEGTRRGRDLTEDDRLPARSSDPVMPPHGSVDDGLPRGRLGSAGTSSFDTGILRRSPEPSRSSVGRNRQPRSRSSTGTMQAAAAAGPSGDSTSRPPSPVSARGPKTPWSAPSFEPPQSDSGWGRKIRRAQSFEDDDARSTQSAPVSKPLLERIEGVEGGSSAASTSKDVASPPGMMEDQVKEEPRSSPPPPPSVSQSESVPEIAQPQSASSESVPEIAQAQAAPEESAPAKSPPPKPPLLVTSSATAKTAAQESVSAEDPSPAVEETVKDASAVQGLPYDGTAPRESQPSEGDSIVVEGKADLPSSPPEAAEDAKQEQPSQAGDGEKVADESVVEVGSAEQMEVEERSVSEGAPAATEAAVAETEAAGEREAEDAGWKPAEESAAEGELQAQEVREEKVADESVAAGEKNVDEDTAAETNAEATNAEATTAKAEGTPPPTSQAPLAASPVKVEPTETPNTEAAPLPASESAAADTVMAEPLAPLGALELLAEASNEATAEMERSDETGIPLKPESSDDRVEAATTAIGEQATFDAPLQKASDAASESISDETAKMEVDVIGETVAVAEAVAADDGDLHQVDADVTMSQAESDPAEEPVAPASRRSQADLEEARRKTLHRMLLLDAKSPLEADIKAVIESNQKMAAQTTFTFLESAIHGPPFPDDGKPIDIYEETAQTERMRTLLTKLLSSKQRRIHEKTERLRRQYKSLNDDWMAHCARLDRAAELRENAKRAATQTSTPGGLSQQHSLPEDGPSIGQASLPQPSVGGRHNRRGTQSTFGFGDAVRSEAEFLEILASLESADMQDPEARAARTATAVPNQLINPDGDKLLKSDIDDKNGFVADPIAFYLDEFDPDYWSQEEKAIFARKYAIWPKQFGKIATALPNKTASQCVYYYYLTKHQPGHDYKAITAARNRNQKRKGKLKPKKAKGSALMADLKSAKGDEPMDEDDATSQTDSAGPSRSRMVSSIDAALGPVPEEEEPSGATTSSGGGKRGRGEGTASADTAIGGEKRAKAPGRGGKRVKGQGKNKGGGAANTNTVTAEQTQSPSVGSPVGPGTPGQTETVVAESDLAAAEALGSLSGLLNPPQPSEAPTAEAAASAVPPPAATGPAAVKAGKKRKAAGAPVEIGEDGQPLKVSKPRQTTSSYWSIQERAEFLRGLAASGKNWSAVAAKLGAKSAAQARNYFARNTEVPDFVEAAEFGERNASQPAEVRESLALQWTRDRFGSTEDLAIGGVKTAMPARIDRASMPPGVLGNAPPPILSRASQEPYAESATPRRGGMGIMSLLNEETSTETLSHPKPSLHEWFGDSAQQQQQQQRARAFLPPHLDVGHSAERSQSRSTEGDDSTDSEDARAPAVPRLPPGPASRGLVHPSSREHEPEPRPYLPEARGITAAPSRPPSLSMGTSQSQPVQTPSYASSHPLPPHLARISTAASMPSPHTPQSDSHGSPASSTSSLRSTYGEYPRYPRSPAFEIRNQLSPLVPLSSSRDSGGARPGEGPQGEAHAPRHSPLYDRGSLSLSYDRSSSSMPPPGLSSVAGSHRHASWGSATPNTTATTSSLRDSAGERPLSSGLPGPSGMHGARAHGQPPLSGPGHGSLLTSAPSSASRSAFSPRLPPSQGLPSLQPPQRTVSASATTSRSLGSSPYPSPGLVSSQAQARGETPGAGAGAGPGDGYLSARPGYASSADVAGESARFRPSSASPYPDSGSSSNSSSNKLGVDPYHYQRHPPPPPPQQQRGRPASLSLSFSQSNSSGSGSGLLRPGSSHSHSHAEHQHPHRVERGGSVGPGGAYGSGSGAGHISPLAHTHVPPPAAGAGAAPPPPPPLPAPGSGSGSGGGAGDGAPSSTSNSNSNSKMSLHLNPSTGSG